MTSCSFSSPTSPEIRDSYAPRNSTGNIETSFSAAPRSTSLYAAVSAPLWYFTGVGMSPVMISGAS